MNIKPLFDNIVLVAPKTNKSSIIVAQNEEKPDIAQVLALGSGGTIDGNDIKFYVQVGDKVLYHKYAASEFMVENQLYILIKQTDIIAVIN